MELLDLARGKYKYVNVNTRQTNQKKNLKIQDDTKKYLATLLLLTLPSLAGENTGNWEM